MSGTYHIAHYRTIARVEREHFWFRARAVMLSAFIDKHIAPNRRDSFLEVGCGTGNVLRVVRDLGFRPVGVDVNASALTFAAINCPEAALIRSSIYTWKSDRRYGAVGAFDVLEHQSREGLFFARCRDLLENDGVLFLTVPSGVRLWSHLDVLSGHKRRYEPDTLRLKLRASGFQVQTMRYWNVLLLPIYIVFRFFTSRRRSVLTMPLYLNKPHSIINAILYAILCLEEWFARWVPFPYGATLVVSARKVAL